MKKLIILLFILLNNSVLYSAEGLMIIPSLSLTDDGLMVGSGVTFETLIFFRLKG